MRGRPAAGSPRGGLWPGSSRFVSQPSIDVIGQVATRAVSSIGLQGHRLYADSFQRRIDCRVDLAGRLKFCRLDKANHFGCVTDEGHTAGQEIIKSRTQAIDVAVRAKKVELALCLLWAHKSGRAQALPGSVSALPLADDRTSGPAGEPECSSA